MSISNTVRKAGPFLCNGTIAPLPFVFKVFLATDVVVTLIDSYGNRTTMTLGTNYVVALNANQDSHPGGSVTPTAAYATGYLIALTSAVPSLQPVVLTNTGGFYPDVLNAEFDRLTIIAEQIEEVQSRQITLPVGDTTNPVLPGAMARAGNVLGFGSDGSPGVFPSSTFVGPPGGNIMAIGLFSSLFSLSVPTGTAMVQTSGYSVLGVGAGLYVSDAMATAIGGTAPNFCRMSADGRYFRLIGPVIYVEQGGATGSGNDRPAIQATLDYAAAVGIFTVECQKEAYSLWIPTRTTNVNTPAPDGHATVATSDLDLRGCAGGTTFTILNSTGGAYSTATQTVGGTPWRGGGMFVWPGGTGTGTINRLSLTRMTITGGVGYTPTGTAPAGNTGPGQTGVDLTGKGFWSGFGTLKNLYFNDCEIWGFTGEICYLGANSVTNIYVNNLRVHDSPQSVWNPAGILGANTGQKVTAVGLVAYNSYGVEIIGGPGQSYTACKFHDLNGFVATGGPANGFGFNYAYPTRVAGTQPPWVDFFDCDWSNSGSIGLGTWVRVHKGCTITDSYLNIIQGTNYSGACGAQFDTFVDARLIVDQANINPGCIFRGPATLADLIPNAPAGNYVVPPKNVHIRFDCNRTANAIANNYFIVPFAFDGYIDQSSCSLSIGEADGVVYAAGAVYGGGTTRALPLIAMEGPTSSQTIGVGRPFGVYPLAMSSGPYAIYVISPRHVLENSGAAATIVCTFAAFGSAPYGYAYGQKCRVRWGGTAGTIYSFPKDGTGQRLNAARGLYASGDWLDVEFNGSTGLWHEVDYHAQNARLIGNNTWAPGTIVAGANAATTLTVTGAALGDAVDVITLASDLQQCSLAAYVSASNTVTITLTNNTGGSKTIASGNLRVEVTK